MQVLLATPPDHQQAEDHPSVGRRSLLGWGGVFDRGGEKEHEKVQLDGLPSQRVSAASQSIQWEKYKVWFILFDRLRNIVLRLFKISMLYL